MGFSDLCGLDLKALGKFGLVGELASVGSQRAIVGSDDLVVHGEVGCACSATVVLDGLFNTQLGCLVFVDEGTGYGCCRIGGRASNVLEADATLGPSHGDVVTHAVDALHVLKVPLVVSTGRDFLLFDGEVRVTNFEGDEGRVVLSVGLTKTGGGQRCKRVGCGHVGAARRSGRGRGLRDAHGAGGCRGAGRIVRPGGAGRHREVGGGDPRVGTRGILDGLHDAHASLLGDDAVEAAEVHRELLCNEGIRTRGVLGDTRRTCRRRDVINVVRGDQRRSVRDEAPNAQAVGAAVLFERTSGNRLVQLDRVGHVGRLVNVALGPRPGTRQNLRLVRVQRAIGLTRAGVVVLAVQVVVAVPLAHVLDAIDTPRSTFRLVLVALRAIGRVDRIRFVGRTNEGTGGRVTRGTVLAALEDPIAGPLALDELVCRPAVKTKVRGAGARAGLACRLHVGAALAVQDRRGQRVRGFLVNEWVLLTLIVGEQIKELQPQR